MRKLVILTAAASIVAGGVAFAGLNPEFPQLPTATYGAAGTFPNNQMSSMCVDCHSRIPQTNGGTHFVSATLLSDTNSSGGWADAAGHPATLRSTTNAGEFFQYEATSQFNSGLYAKYGDGTNSVIVTGATADVGDGVVGTEPTDTAAPDYFTSIPGGADPATFDLICESCHNIINNVAGGNNLLEVPSDGTNWWTAADASEASLCLGCHGYMYSDTGVHASQTPQAFGDAEYADPRNTTSYAGARGNNEAHYIAGEMYSMNHHVMAGDNISAAKIGQGYAWRDVTVFAGTDAVMSVNQALGQYPNDGAWAPDKSKTTTGAFNCLNCHTAGHGSVGGVTMAPATTGASILRDDQGDSGGSSAATAIQQIARIGENSRGWFTFNDGLYCNNCHHLPGGLAVTP